MKILLIGSGGREHALAWKLAQSPQVQTVYVAPGNGGTATAKQTVAGIQNLPISDLQELADFAEREKIHLTVVGPEAPLAAGIVNVFRNHGLRIFGPTQLAAQLESSKDFSKAFMKRHGIPTAEYQTFSNALEAHAYIDAKRAPIVIKADGLAAGKGVVVAMDLAEAHVKAVERLVKNKQEENFELFNIGTGNGFSVLEVIQSFEKENNIKVPHKIGPRRNGDVVLVIHHVNACLPLKWWCGVLPCPSKSRSRDRQVPTAARPRLSVLFPGRCRRDRCPPPHRALPLRRQVRARCAAPEPHERAPHPPAR